MAPFLLIFNPKNHKITALRLFLFCYLKQNHYFCRSKENVLFEYTAFSMLEYNTSLDLIVCRKI